MLERLGARVSYTARPNFDLEKATINYQTLLNSVMTAAWDDQTVAQMQAKVAALEATDLSRDAVNARAAVLSHREWIRANSRREKLRHAWADFFEDWDILVCPQMATEAFSHDHRPFKDRNLMVDGEQQPLSLIHI